MKADFRIALLAGLLLGGRGGWALRDGFVELNDRPGLGVDVDEATLSRRRYDRAMLFRQYRHADGSWKGW